MRVSEWRQTPYAMTDVRDPDGAIRKLLQKHGVTDIQWTEASGPNNRPAVSIRFVLKRKTYRIMLETLDVDYQRSKVNHDLMRNQLICQVKRAIFHYLKSVLEMTGVFFSAEQALLSHLELPQGGTVFENLEGQLDRLDCDGFKRLLLLPPKKQESQG